MTYIGDFAAGATVRLGFNTNAVAGESITLATDGAINVYKDGGIGESVAGVTFSENFDGKTGAHLVTIVTSDAFYAAGSDYMVMLAGATIDGKAINAWIGHFSIANRPVQSLASSALTTIAAGVWDRLTSALTTTGSIGAYLLSKVGLIGSASATVLSPMQSNGTIRLIQAVSYDNIAQNKLRITDGGGWSSTEPDSIKFYVQQLNSPSNLLAIEADDWDWAATPKWVDVELTTTDTEKLQFGKHDYTLVATWTGTPNSYDELASGPLPAKLREWSLT